MGKSHMQLCVLRLYFSLRTIHFTKPHGSDGIINYLHTELDNGNYIYFGVFFMQWRSF
jgi:hypothetical protein